MHRPRWQQQGQEPDYRFTLANERTFLAWIRTALAVLAGAVLLDQFAVGIEPRLALSAVAVTLSALAALLCGMAYWRWKHNESAMRQGLPLPPARLVPVLAAALCLASLVLAVLLLP